MVRKLVRRWKIWLLLLLMIGFFTTCGSQKSSDSSISETDPTEYDVCLDRAVDEKVEDVRPVLIEMVSASSEYHKVFSGYPNWWYRAPSTIFFLNNTLAWKKMTLAERRLCDSAPM